MKISYIKKNQIVIAVVGLMLITAGYLNFTNSENSNQLLEAGTLTDAVDMAEIGDAQLVSSKPANDSDLLNEENGAHTIGDGEENITADNNSDIAINDEQNAINEDEMNASSNEEGENTTQTNANVTTDEYFTNSRLERDTMYSEMLESYQKILDKTTISENQRTSAQNEITKINNQKNAIMITENLIKTKGFEDLIIFVNDTSINVIVKAKELTTEQIAQIQNIITRELNADIDNIHISNKE